MFRIVFREMEQRVCVPSSHQALPWVCYLLKFDHVAHVSRMAQLAGEGVGWRAEEQQGKQETECAEERPSLHLTQLAAAATAV